MTETTEQVAGTALQQVAPGSAAYALATDPARKWALAALLEALDGTPAKAEEVKAPAPPEAIEVKPELREALRKLSEVFGGVQPAEARKLTETEVESITIEADAINAVATLIGKRSKAIDEAMRHHMDAEARELGIDGPVVTTGVAKGHILAANPGDPFEVMVPGFSDPWQQRFVKGSSELNMGLLADLLAGSRITREEFLSLTSQVRDLDETKIKAAVKRSPARVLSILKAITVRKPDTASLYSPKK